MVGMDNFDQFLLSYVGRYGGTLVTSEVSGLAVLSFKPGLHIVAMIVSTVASIFPTLSQAILNTREHFDCNITSFTSIVINCSVLSSWNDRNHYPRQFFSLVSRDMANLNQSYMAKQLLTPFATHCTHDFSLKNYGCQLFCLIGTVKKYEM